MTDDGSVGSGCSGEGTTITDLLLDTADDRSFGELAYWENISNVEDSLLAAVDKSTGVETFGGDEGLFTELVTVWITEDDTGKGSATTSSTMSAIPCQISNKTYRPESWMISLTIPRM